MLPVEIALPELLLLSRYGAARILWFILVVQTRSGAASADWNHSASYEALRGGFLRFAFGGIHCLVLQDFALLLRLRRLRSLCWMRRWHLL